MTWHIGKSQLTGEYISDSSDLPATNEDTKRQWKARPASHKEETELPLIYFWDPPPSHQSRLCQWQNPLYISTKVFFAELKETIIYND